MSRWIHFLTQTHFAYAFVVLMVLGLPLAAQASNQGPLETQELEAVKVVTKGGERTFVAEIANTPSQRARGLMFRTRLSERHGTLFDFGRDQEIRIWMKNTLIPLDMIFIQSDGRIQRIEQNTEPGSLRPISSDGLRTCRA
jgi:uncharacterized membrane protein (UPF0127 family)